MAALLWVSVLLVLVAGALPSMLEIVVALAVIGGVIVLPAWLIVLAIERGERER